MITMEKPEFGDLKLYERNKMKKLILDYNADGESITPFNAEMYKQDVLDTYSNLLNRGYEEEAIINVSTELAIDLVRLLVVEDEIDLDKVQVIARFENHILIMDKNGIFDKWPTGFLDMSERVCRRIIKARVRSN